mgnify:FL=1
MKKRISQEQKSNKPQKRDKTVVSVEFSGDTYSVINGKQRDDGQVSFFKDLKISKIFKEEFINAVRVSKNNFEKIGNARIIVFDKQSGKYLEVTVFPFDMSDDEMQITDYVREQFFAAEDPSRELSLLLNRAVVFSKFKTQKIDFIKEDDLVLSPEDYSAFRQQIEEYKLFEVTNYYTNESFVIKSSHIRTESTLKKGEIRINKKQRIFLGLETPKYFNRKRWDYIIANLKISNKNDEAKFLSDCYNEELLLKDIGYESEQKVKRIIEKNMPIKLLFSPVIDSFYNLNRQSGKKLTDFYVGKSTITLICRRPYDSDEGADIVRMTKSNMDVLGIENMDRVLLKYKNNSIVCQVLEIDEERLFYNTNLPIETNMAIGVPAHIRKKLGVNLNSTIKIDRDTAFIFRKSINEQVVPILLTLFSISAIKDIGAWKAAALSLLAVPVVVYFNLSAKRNKRGAK